MFVRLLVVGFLSALYLSLPAYCQSPPANQAAALPDYALYDQFLYRVTWFEAQANNLKAKGKDDTFMRSWMKVNVGLTAQEESSLKTVAADCEESTTATKSAIQSLAATATGSAVTQQVQALMNQRKQTVLNHISQLQTAFGAERYAVLDAFARRIVTFKPGPPVPPGFVPKAPPAVPAPGK